MKCPYCRNDIPNNSIKCEICGVDLEEPLNARRNTRTISVISLVIGIVCLVTTFMFSVIEIFGKRVFGMNFSYSDVMSITRSYVVVSLLVGVIFTAIGIIGLRSSKTLKENNRSSQNFGSIIVFAFMFIFIFIFFTVFNFITNSFTKFGLDARFVNLFIIPIAVTGLLMLFGFIISVVKGNKK